MRILVADDNDIVRRGVVDILRSEEGWEVCGEARNGLDAVQKARELLPDIIILDVSMPGMGGLEAMRLLREQVTQAKILIISQHDPNLLLQRVIEAGGHGCLDKSLLASELLVSIRRLREIDRIAGDFL
jgi:DNA-binding NarL/FixJ family response regulator